MDAEAFGLSRNPFQRIPELDEACLPNTFASLLAELQSALRSPQGVSVLVGETGSGKTMAAAAFARRLANVAQVALLPHPTSSVSAIARDAMILFGASAGDGEHEDWVEALMAETMRRARSGKPTVIILDDAHRLSPQTLEDLAELFDEDEPAMLHLFLFGRPRLLDRMHAGPEKALHAHLLQVGRLEPLGLRESVRYLERRIALCGSELASLFDEGAIDELVRVSAGRLVHLERNALDALERASRKNASRVTAEHVRPVAMAAGEAEEAPVPARQQALQFEMPDDIDDRDVGWQAGDEEDDEDWGVPDGQGEEAWEAAPETEDEELGDEEIDEDELDGDDELSWDAASAPDDEVPGLDDPSHGDDDGFARVPASAAAGQGRSRMMGRAVLSVMACIGLVWVANHLPGPGGDNGHGRDAKLFAERLSSTPSDILRVAESPEDADARAQVDLWRVQPPRPVAPVAAPQAVAAAKSTAGKSVETAALPPPPAPDASAMGPAPLAPVRETVSLPKPSPVQVASVPKATVASAAKKPAAKAPVAVSGKAPAKGGSKPEAVFTVQLGAFKARSNAEQVATKLRGRSARIVREGSLYRVYSGSFANKREAAVHEASLRRQGFSTFVTTAVF